ncbi:hypothetical protein GCM10028796_01270 [Ramlibacter monticola]|uniref:ATP-binding protein n=1 Tax=Ramlibacter monticola TaxID=1926872 RepID=A0A937CTF9_9BURK|nr:ATP-binding protein [Ramlibacter monticola]MBL0391579.1 ATP-binding protein [Ramlibacter monticola]
MSTAQTPLQPHMDVADALSVFAVTDSQVEKMQATEFIWREVIARSHLVVLAGEGGSGKTAVATFAASELANAGLQVFYFQEDAGAGDVPRLHQHAKKHGYVLLNSTLASAAPEDQIKVLRSMVKAAAPLNNVVMFFDTLKKYLDLMSKRGSREFFMLMRSLTQLGGTVVLLGHTNKHAGMDGKRIFEGVGDVRNDVDELIYAHATDKDAGGRVTITLTPDKVRCNAQKRSFQLDIINMEVCALDALVDVASLLETRQRLESDRPIIDQVERALSAGGLNHTVLLDRVSEATGESRNAVRKVVDRYMGSDPSDERALWLETRLRVNNTRYISVRPSGASVHAES